MASGPSKGKRKDVGITATGTRAKTGTIAADTSIYPFGTIMYVPGYGYGRVEDVGSAIKGMHACSNGVIPSDLFTFRARLC